MAFLNKLYSPKLVGFLGVGVVSVAVNFGVTTFLHEILSLVEEISFLIGIIAAMGCNFCLLRYVLFKSYLDNFFQQFFKFILSSIAFRGFEYLGFLIIHTWLHFWYLGAMFVVQLLSFFIKFYFYDAIFFKRK